MNSVIVPFVVGYLLDQVATATASSAPKWSAGFDEWVTTASPWLKAHPAFATMIENVANPIIVAVAAALQDETDLKAAIVALAGTNPAAASAALLALVKQSAPGLGPVLAAAA